MNKYQYYYPAVLRPEDEGGYSIWIPDLPGCISQGETIPEAVEMIQEAMELYISYSYEKNNLPKPPSNPQDVALEAGEFMVMVACDLLSYEKKHKSKAVKKTLTIPAWLNEIAEHENVNFSAVLQEALLQKFDIH